MDKILEFFIGFNIQNLLSMAAIMWYFTRDIKKDIERVDHDLRKMNTRIGRLEGTVYGKDIYTKIEE